MRFFAVGMLALAGCAVNKPAVTENNRRWTNGPCPPLVLPRVRRNPRADFRQARDDPYRWLEDEKAPRSAGVDEGSKTAARANLHALPGRDKLHKRYTELYYLDAMGAPPVKRKRAGATSTRARHKDKEKAVVYWKPRRRARRTCCSTRMPGRPTTRSRSASGCPRGTARRSSSPRSPTPPTRRRCTCSTSTRERSAVDVITGAKYASPSWLPDSKAFIYEWLPTDAKIPTSERPGYCEVKKHVLGDDPAKDEQLHPRTGDPKTFIGGGSSRDGKFLFVSIMRGWNENDVFFKRVGKDKDLAPAGRRARTRSTPSTRGRVVSTSSPTKARPTSASSGSTRRSPRAPTGKS